MGSFSHFVALAKKCKQLFISNINYENKYQIIKSRYGREKSSQLHNW